MNPSPITFVSLKFLRVHVESDFEAPRVAENFSFDGTMLAWSLNHGREGDGTWWVAVGFATDGDADTSARCPYNINMQALGHFRISDTVDADKLETIVFENGAALVYGAIRDMVSTITSRSAPGPLMLPTPTFVGAFAEHQQKPSQMQVEQ